MKLTYRAYRYMLAEIGKLMGHERMLTQNVTDAELQAHREHLEEQHNLRLHALDTRALSIFQNDEPTYDL